MAEGFHKWPWELAAADGQPRGRAKLIWFWRWQEVMKHRAKRTEIENERLKRSYGK